jgi:hypothetical protein
VATEAAWQREQFGKRRNKEERKKETKMKEEP